MAKDDRVMKKNIFKIFGLACVITACVNEMPDNGSQVPSSGDAVNFVAGLGSSQTKTVYGAESTDRKSIKVNWVENDQISVYGTNAAKGREQGTYKVTSVLTNEAGYSYAGDLQMTGDHGVQWGGGRSSFYAVYPSTSGSFESLADGSGVKVPVSISGVQNNFFTFENNTWTGVQGNSESNQTMTDAIMYACNTGEDGDGLLSGATVNLQFKPFSTVLKFTLNGVGTPSGKTKVYINEIDVIAPTGTNISGTFPLTIKSDKTATAGTITNGSGTVIIKPYSIDETTNETVNNICVEADDIIEFCVFTVPQENLNLSGWKVRLVTSHGTKTFTISDATANVNAKLLAGQIHKVRVPVLATLEDDFKFNPEEWIAQLPTAVYLSELSLPGSWYSTNAELNDAGVGYQESSVTTIDGVEVRSTDLGAQYKAGIRAFNIDTRLSIKANLDSDDFDNNYSTEDYNPDPAKSSLVLACAGTETEEVEDYYFFVRPTGKMLAIGKTVEQALIELGQLISLEENQDEFIVVVITVAEKGKTHSNKTYGTTDSKMMLKAISDVLNYDSVKKYLYNDHITEKTTIDDVLGKIIVKVNINDSAFCTGTTVNSAYTSYTAPMMITYAEMSTTYTSYPMACGLDYKANSSLNYIAHQAQSTSSSNLSSRKNTITSISDIAYNNYTPEQNEDPNDQKIHAWYQLGIGGSYDSYKGRNNEYTYIAQQLNKHVYDIIQTRLNNKTYAPVGIVLMNQVTNSNESVYSKQLIDAILTLNAKMRLEAAKGTPPTPAPAKNAAYAEVGEDAF